MLKDKISIKIMVGKGGIGSNYIFLRRANGGDGGRGGSVFVKGSENIYDLNFFKPWHLYKADNGEFGRRNNRNGSRGKDLILLVPLTTEVTVELKEPITYIIDTHNQIVRLRNGCKGGLGNVSRKKHPEVKTNLPRATPEPINVHMIFKMKADIMFIGYPNAGKSSLLNALTNAKVKVAPYEFTTLDPQIGVMNGIKIMDLPGLIEDTHKGKGLGTKFLKHTEHVRNVAHVISLENDDPVKAYKTMRAEIKAISKDLYKKPEVIILTKTDEVTKEKLKATSKKIKGLGLTVISCSILDDSSIKKVQAKLKTWL
ncbi:50S ribosome-binding GTPase [Candidatus Dojkabacteria bacterium]|nr:50S ribosome-binding GTPase [Candidatus Dojkabacteria bacterium]